MKCYNFSCILIISFFLLLNYNFVTGANYGEKCTRSISLRYSYSKSNECVKGTKCQDEYGQTVSFGKNGHCGCVSKNTKQSGESCFLTEGKKCQRAETEPEAVCGPGLECSIKLFEENGICKCKHGFSKNFKGFCE